MRKDELRTLQNFNKGLTALIERNKANLKYLKDKNQVTYTLGKIYAYEYIQNIYIRNVMIDLTREISNNEYNIKKSNKTSNK